MSLYASVTPPLGRQSSLADAIDAFLLSREVANASKATLTTYAYNLNRFSRHSGVQCLGRLTLESIQRYLVDMRARVRPITAHQGFRVLRTFCRWCLQTGRLSLDPMAGMTMKVPKTMPRVPDSTDVRRLLAACPSSPEGRRNRALIALAADSGLRREELRGLRIEDLDMVTRVIQVRGGKGQKDGVAFFGEFVASVLREWLIVHPEPRPGAFLFCTRAGVVLGPHAILHILHRVSVRAGLDRKVGPHALRHYAATTLLRRTGDLELVRRVLRHESLTMTLRYATLTDADIAAKFQRSSPLDNLGPAGRGRAL